MLGNGIVFYLYNSDEQEGNTDPALKPDFDIFLLIFQHKWIFHYHLKVTMWHISDQSNTVCKYEVNLSTNEKVITEKQNFNPNC